MVQRPPMVAEEGRHVWTAAEVDLAREGTRVLGDGGQRRAAPARP